MPVEFSFRLIAGLILCLFACASIAGLVGLTLPAFGYFPALGGDQFNLDAWQILLTMPGFWGAVRTSFMAGLVATFIALVISYLLLSVSYGTAYFVKLERALAPFLSLPHAALALGLAMVLTPSGLLFRIAQFSTPPDVGLPNDPWAFSLVLGLIVKEVPFFLLVSLAALHSLSPDRQLAVAQSLGYGRITGFAKILLPQIHARIRLPIFAVLSYSAAPPEMALILGPQDPPLLMVMILRLMNAPDLDLRFVASAAGLVQLAVIIALLSVWLVVEKLAAYGLRGMISNGDRVFAERACKISAGIAAVLLGLLFLSSFIVLVLWSVAESWRFPDILPQVFSFAYWQKEFGSLWFAGFTSLWLGLLVSGIAVILAVLLLEAQNPMVGFILYAPLILPQISLLLGLQIVGLESVVFAHLLYVVAYVHISLLGPWRRMDKRYVQIAASLGAGAWWRLLAVKIPLLAPVIVNAFALGFSVSISLYLPSLLMGAGRFVTLTTEAIAVQSGGDRRIIAVTALLQAILPLFMFGLANEWMRSRRQV